MKTTYEVRNEILEEQPQLQGIEITSGMNGYPQNLRAGIIGFDCLSDAEALAKAVGGSVVMFHRRDGWQLWDVASNCVSEEFDIHNLDGRDDRLPESYVLVDEIDDLRQLAQERMSDMLDAGLPLEEVAQYMQAIADAQTDVENLDMGEVLVCDEYDGDNFHVEKVITMSITYDTHHYTIGVELENQDDDE